MGSNSFWKRAQASLPGPKSVPRLTAWYLIALATWYPVITTFNIHVAEIVAINGSSMYPLMNTDKDSTLRRDRVLSWKWGAQKNLERGMVVTLRSPYNPDTVAVKRIVALEDDVIRTKEPYPVSTVKVPPGHVWVEGDGPPGTSLDSNTYGAVSKRLIVGKITGVVYPFSKFGPINWRDHQRPLVP